MSLETIRNLESKTQSNGFVVHKTDQLTLGEIIALYQGGIGVVRTPHVGNFSDGNLSVLACGLPAVILDTNQLQADDIYHPAHLIKTGTSSPLCSVRAGLVTAFAQVTTGENSGQSLVEFHIQALREAFRNNSQFLTLTKYLELADTDLIQALIMVTATEFPQIFKRKLGNDGIARPLTTNDIVTLINREGIFAITNKSGGVMIPNEIFIILDVLIHYFATNSRRLIELTGKTMYQYVDTDYASKLATIYSRLRSLLPERGLPEKLELILVPTSAARATVAATDEPKMRAVFDAYEEFEKGARMQNKLKGALIGATSASDRPSFIQFLASASRDLNFTAKRRLEEAVKALPAIFSPRWDARVTQHDLGEGYFMDPRVLTMTQSELALMMRTCDKLFSQ